MTEIEAKALALVNEVATPGHTYDLQNLAQSRPFKALLRAIEQHEAFKQQVSDAVEAWRDADVMSKVSAAATKLHSFILPKPVDPLVEALEEAFPVSFADAPMCPGDPDKFRAALAARGLEIREMDKSKDQPPLSSFERKFL